MLQPRSFKVLLEKMTSQLQDIYAKEEYLLSVEGVFHVVYGDTVKRWMVLFTIASDVT